MTVTIRDTSPADAEAIERIRYAAWLVTYPNAAAGISKEDIEKGFEYRFTEAGLAERAKKIRGLKKNDRFVVAETAGMVIGFGVLVRHEDHNRLRSLYILPEYQGRGVGTMIWEALREASDPQKDTLVEVATYNEKTIRFYSKLGFEDTGRRLTRPFKGARGKTIPEMEMVFKVL